MGTTDPSPGLGDGSVVNSFHHQHVLPPPRVHLIPPPLSALFAARCAVCRTTISGGLPPPSPDILSRLCSVPKTFEHLATIANNAMMASGPNARLFLKDSDMAKEAENDSGGLERRLGYFASNEEIPGSYNEGSPTGCESCARRS